nr:hypothetical protein A5881_000062 [Enterococcus termitis]
MENVKTLYVTGYKSFEIGAFQDNDPKITAVSYTHLDVYKRQASGFPKYD